MVDLVHIADQFPEIFDVGETFLVVIVYFFEKFRAAGQQLRYCYGVTHLSIL